MADLIDENRLSEAVKDIITSSVKDAGSDIAAAPPADGQLPQKPGQADGSQRVTAVRRYRGREIKCEPFPFDIGDAKRGVFTKDIMSAAESPNLGFGFMEVCGVRFPWTLQYDEVEYVVEGVLEITANGEKTTGTPGDVIYIPKGSAIQFSSPTRARFLYVTYPANWQDQK